MKPINLYVVQLISRTYFRNVLETLYQTQDIVKAKKFVVEKIDRIFQQDGYDDMEMIALNIRQIEVDPQADIHNNDIYDTSFGYKTIQHLETLLELAKEIESCEYVEEFTKKKNLIQKREGIGASLQYAADEQLRRFKERAVELTVELSDDE